MAEEYPDIPLEHLAGLGSGPAPRPSDRDLLDYYLGPTGIPDRVRSANQLLNPIAALEELGAQSAVAADPDLSPEERRRAALAAALGTGLLAIPAARPLAKSLPAFRSIDDDAARAVVETLTGAAPDLPGEALLREVQPTPGAVIRRDDVFRGVGPARVSDIVTNSGSPFAVRVTGQSQIDDMIESGLVRPKPGGYGKKQSSQIYFGTRDTNTVDPSSPFTGLGPGKEYALIARPDRLGAYEGGVPIDELEHIWTQRDGELVDVLPEILRRNREFGD